MLNKFRNIIWMKPLYLFEFCTCRHINPTRFSKIIIPISANPILIGPISISILEFGGLITSFLPVTKINRINLKISPSLEIAVLPGFFNKSIPNKVNILKPI